MKNPQIEPFDISALPDRLRLNLHIYMHLRSVAMVRYAEALARATVSRHHSDEWFKARDKYVDDWCAVNPVDPMWASDKCPVAANDDLGIEALMEARKLMGF